MTGKLPPPPPGPKRILTPPARKAIGAKPFDFDAKTPTKNSDIQHATALMSVFDPMSQAEREELVELAFLYRELDPPRRRASIVVMRKLLDKQNER